MMEKWDHYAQGALEEVTMAKLDEDIGVLQAQGGLRV